ncbi:MAG: flavodoxin family protein [Candidatus Thorarchaeota archaeon]|nr:MAG: flavodoxin family protein [Candidatus Thorarchaeota archaeon]
MIVGIGGSPKKEKSNTRFLLEKALAAASEVLRTAASKESTTLLLDISDFEIRHCTGCDACVRKKPCPESAHDDMPDLERRILPADGIIIAAPSYFTSVPGALKDFMDRSRTMKMLDHQLKDKVFGAITYAGLRYGGQEHVIDVLNRYALGQGMIVVGAVGSPVKHGTFGSGSMQTDEGKWRSSEADALAIDASEELGRRVAQLVMQTNGSEG